MKKYIYQYDNWPHFTWDTREILGLLGEVRHLQGILVGQINSLGFSFRSETMLSALTLETVKSFEIEGEKLNDGQVRSSVARRLGLEYAGMMDSGKDVDGVVDMMLDATQNYETPLDEERLFSWHAVLFPFGRSGLQKVNSGSYRKGAMQIVSGPIGKEKIHYQAPSADQVKSEMNHFLNWFKNETKSDPVLKAAIAHFWFIIIHPFDDGNGRIARAISDMLLARSENSAQRFYSLSNQMLIEKKKYYAILQKVQYSSGDITAWISWFLQCLYRSLQATEDTIKNVLHKAEFWDQHRDTSLNARQRFMLNKLLDGIVGKLQSSKWAKMAKCSSDTALRDIKDLIEKGILKEKESGGRSTHYEIVEF